MASIRGAPGQGRRVTKSDRKVVAYRLQVNLGGDCRIAECPNAPHTGAARVDLRGRVLDRRRCASAARAGGPGAACEAEERHPIPLSSIVRSDGLPLLAELNHSGLGEEAERIVAWLPNPRGEVRLKAAELRDAGGRALAVSEAMADVLVWSNGSG